MATFEEVLDQLRENQPQGKYGIAFEKLMVNFFRTTPSLAEQFDEVCRWSDWRYNGGRVDTGIDMVAHRVADDSWGPSRRSFISRPLAFKKATLIPSLKPLVSLS